MTVARVAAALAALLSAVLLQATLVGPLTLPAPASLPALLVAAVALTEGSGAGLTLGFVTGLTADLGSGHPAGILALAWLGVGLFCGRWVRPGASVRRDALLAAGTVGVATLASSLAIAAWAGTPSLAHAARLVVPAVLLDALLALVVVGMVRLFLRSPRLRPARPVLIIGEELR